MKNILVVDGNYFAHRCLGSVNMGDSVNNLRTKNEINNFKAALNSSLINLWTTFSPFCQQIIFVTDNHSWRKDVPAIKPYYVTDNRPIGYKEQRVEKKEESPIDYDVFYQLYNEFVENIKSFMIVFHIYGLEGDDHFALISNKMQNYQNINCIGFCNDGDLNQTVKNNFILYRNIKSKEAPFGEFVITENKYKEIFEKKSSDVKTTFFQNTVDSGFYNRLFSMSMTGQFNIKRTLDAGISIATPFKTALIGSICGQKKDNIFSLMGWKSAGGTGDREYKITENHIGKALDSVGMKFTEANCKQILSDKDDMITMLNALKSITKQTGVNLKSIMPHLQHNLKINILSLNNIPEQYLIDFNNIWLAFENEIINNDFDHANSFRNLNVNRQDSATNLMQQSLPSNIEIID